MILARAEAARSTNSAAAVSKEYDAKGDDCLLWHYRIIIKRNGVTALVELDQFKSVMLAYEEPLAELRDSL